MKNLFLLLIIILGVGCGAKEHQHADYVIPGSQREYVSTDPSLSSYKQNIYPYQTLSEESDLRDIPFNFKDLSEYAYLAKNDMEVAAVCVKPAREVFIDPVIWAKASEARRKFIIGHEVGHCLYDREHDDSLLGIWSYKKSLMSTDVFNYIEFEEHGYLLELTTGSTEQLERRTKLPASYRNIEPSYNLPFFNLYKVQKLSSLNVTFKDQVGEKTTITEYVIIAENTLSVKETIITDTDIQSSTWSIPGTIEINKLEASIKTPDISLIKGKLVRNDEN